ncbi:MAG TPA: DNA polymerase IV [Steroidobacteraceae bacterium]|nr:DNA polymerase IV [Steroidobacteraceae bacterium]
MIQRWILHVDMDAFYASVEELDNPELRGTPLIVGGTGGRGVVAAASYEVRKYGVRSAMPMGEALRLCPHAVCVRPRFARYQEISAQVFAIFHEFTPLVEGLSLDEAFLDVTHSQTALGSAEQIAAEIKRRIRERTGLTASVGVAPNKLVAKIASDLRKPDGLVIVKPDEVTQVLDPLAVGRLFGIGPKTAAQLQARGIHTLRDLRSCSDCVLQALFGKYAVLMRERARGIDDRDVIPDADEKQISAEETFEHDLKKPEQMHAQLAELIDRAAARLRAQEWLAGRVTVKIRRSDFRTFTRQATLQPPTRETRSIGEQAHRLLDVWIREQPRAAVRLLGVGTGDLTRAPQLDLFAADSRVVRDKRLDSALDTIRDKFGRDALTRASSLRKE